MALDGWRIPRTKNLMQNLLHMVCIFPIPIRSRQWNSNVVEEEGVNLLYWSPLISNQVVSNYSEEEEEDDDGGVSILAIGEKVNLI